MKVIYKYVLTSPDCLIEMPAEAVLLSAGYQSNATSEAGQLVVWAIVELDNPPENRRLISVNTGGPVDFNVFQFLNTVTTDSGIVWHIFEAEI